MQHEGPNLEFLLLAVTTAESQWQNHQLETSEL